MGYKTKYFDRILILAYFCIFVFATYALFIGNKDSKNLNSRGKIITGEVIEIYGLTKEKVSFKYKFKGKEYKKIRTIYKKNDLYRNGKIKLKIDTLKPTNVMYLPW